MRTFLITYDLAHPHRNKHALASAIMGLAQSWARPLEHAWFVKGDIGESDIETGLSRWLDEDDGLLIQPVEDPAVLANTSLRWFRQRRPAFDVEANSNVVAFPVIGAAPPAQAELPLAVAG